MVARFLGKGADQGKAVTVDGVSWRSWTTDDGFALTRKAAKDTLYVGGKAGRAATLQLAGTLTTG